MRRELLQLGIWLQSLLCLAGSRGSLAPAREPCSARSGEGALRA